MHQIGCRPCMLPPMHNLRTVFEPGEVDGLEVGAGLELQQREHEAVDERHLAVLLQRLRQVVAVDVVLKQTAVHAHSDVTGCDCVR